MYRGCRRLVCSLVCVFSILFMLFLDTCTVKADPLRHSFTINGTVTADACTLMNAGVTAGYISNGTGSISSPGGYYQASDGFYHFEIPVNIAHSWQEYNSTSRPDYMTGYVALDFSLDSFSTSGDCILQNLYVRDTNGNISNFNKVDYTYRIFSASRDTSNSKFTVYLCGDAYWLDKSSSSAYTYNPVLSKTFSVTCNYWFNLREPTQTEIDNSKTQVIEGNSSAIAESSEETADNTGSILTSITDFFGSFFENLIGIFVPEDGYFSGWFDRVNTLLSEKLGMLYAPFDLVLSTLQAIYSSSTTESGIPFPGIKWEDTWLVEPFTFTFASLGSDFDDLRDKVYFATDTVLVLTFLMLLQSKVKLILEGHE